MPTQHAVAHVPARVTWSMVDMCTFGESVAFCFVGGELENVTRTDSMQMVNLSGQRMLVNTVMLQRTVRTPDTQITPTCICDKTSYSFS